MCGMPQSSRTMVTFLACVSHFATSARGVWAPATPARTNASRASFFIGPAVEEDRSLDHARLAGIHASRFAGDLAFQRVYPVVRSSNGGQRPMNTHRFLAALGFV